MKKNLAQMRDALTIIYFVFAFAMNLLWIFFFILFFSLFVLRSNINNHKTQTRNEMNIFFCEWAKPKKFVFDIFVYIENITEK